MNLLEAKVRGNDAHISGIDQRLDLVESQIRDIASQQMVIASSRYAEFDPVTDQGYLVADAGIVKLLISIEDVSMYASGSKVTILIGNPNAVTLSGLAGEAVYGPSMKNGPRPQKTTKLTIPTSIMPGQWNKVSITLPDIAPKDLGSLSIRLDANQVKLARLN